jgi:AAA+ ATPase superfamily predicted ATPase
MTDFVGRDDQLALLAEELDLARRSTAKPGRMLALRGRRQVGKSTLVEEFIQHAGVPAVFYVASKQTAERELELLAEAIAVSETSAASVVKAGPLGSWEAALTLLATEATPESPLIIVIDELPYLIDSVPEIEGSLQKVWDRTLEKTNVLLLLVGSDLSMMAALNEYGRPLYGRFREVVIPPLSPAEIAEMLDMAAGPALDACLVIGGFPRLAAMWRRGESMWKFLERELGDATTSLAVIGERAVNAEFPADLQARQVLEAIGSGERSYGAIEQRSGVPQTSLNRSLETLQEKGVVLKMQPYSSKANPKPPRYIVADSYLRFWLRFINSNLELIQRGRGDIVLERIRESWPTYRGRAIEPLVREAIERMLPSQKFSHSRFVGGYWTRDNSVEVDLVGGRQEQRSDVIDFVGSIKWKEKSPFNRDDFGALVERRGRIPGADANALLVGVSRAGFSADGLDIQLGPDELIAAWRR